MRRLLAALVVFLPTIVLALVLLTVSKILALIHLVVDISDIEEAVFATFLVAFGVTVVLGNLLIQFQRFDDLPCRFRAQGLVLLNIVAQRADLRIQCRNLVTKRLELIHATIFFRTRHAFAVCFLRLALVVDLANLLHELRAFCLGFLKRNAIRIAPCLGMHGHGGQSSKKDCGKEVPCVHDRAHLVNVQANRGE